MPILLPRQELALQYPKQMAHQSPLKTPSMPESALLPKRQHSRSCKVSIVTKVSLPSLHAESACRTGQATRQQESCLSLNDFSPSVSFLALPQTGCY